MCLKDIFGVLMTNGSKTQYAILGALSIQPMSGYEIKKMMAGSTNYFWTESNGQLYPTLAKLARNKFVTVEKHMVGEKIKKIYTITKTGLAKLKDWLTQDYQYYPVRKELLLKIFYGQNVTPNVSIQHIQKHLQKCQNLLKIYKDIEKKLTLLVKQGKRPVYFLLTVKAGVGTVKTEIAWCEESIDLIKKYNTFLKKNWQIQTE